MSEETVTKGICEHGEFDLVRGRPVKGCLVCVAERQAVEVIHNRLLTAQQIPAPLDEFLEKGEQR